MTDTPKRNRSRAEKLLDEVRRKPSPRSRDPRQLDLIDHLTREDRRRAFARLDEAISEALDKGGRP
jgi:hypothetical protein